MLSDLRYRLRAIFRSRAMERELESELQPALRTGSGESRRRGHPASRSPASGAPRDGWDRTTQGRMPRRARRIRLRQHGARHAVCSAPAPETPRLLAGGDRVPRARHRRQYRDLYAHRCRPAPIAAGERPAGAVVRGAPSTGRNHLRLRLQRIPEAPGRQPSLQRYGGLRQHASRREHRRQLRANS